MEKLIIEVRGNEYADRQLNQNVPWSSSEIAKDSAECREAGAAIYHYHARNADGSPSLENDEYADSARGIRKNSDILIHPTLGFVAHAGTEEDRLSHIVALSKSDDTFPDFAPIDLGSTNVDLFDTKLGSYQTKDRVYTNSTATLEYFAKRIPELGVRPYFVSWNIGFSRLFGDFLNFGIIAETAFVAFCMTEDFMHCGHPGTVKGLMAHLDFLPSGRKIEWSAYVEGSNLFRLASTIIAEGGHISIGLGDYPYLELGTPTNAELVTQIAHFARLCGREVATPQEARGILGLPSQNHVLLGTTN